jgi:alkylation response protein AidB-like acyl-CoA dehydrogenase
LFSDSSSDNNAIQGVNMDFSLQPDTAEIAAFRKEVREWLTENMRGSEHLRWSGIWSTRENEEEYRFRRELARKLGQKRWLFPTYPVQYGGAGLTLDHQFVLETEIDRYGLPLGSIFYTLARLVAPAVLKFGTEEQKQEFLPPMMRGELAVWQVLTEPQGGSDVANCLTRAIRDGDHYIVNGQKIMVGHHLPPDFLWTLVCTNPGGKRHENLGWLYIPATLPGITIQHLHLMMGIKNAVFFDSVRVPAKYLVGGENNGWKVANSYLELEHGGGGSVAENPLFKRLIEHCRKTEGSGRPGRDCRYAERSRRAAAHGPAEFLASLRARSPSLRRAAVPLLATHGAAQECRASAAYPGLRRAGAGRVCARAG